VARDGDLWIGAADPPDELRRLHLDGPADPTAHGPFWPPPKVYNPAIAPGVVRLDVCLLYASYVAHAFIRL